MIEITVGLFEGQVLQRTAAGVSDAAIRGHCTVDGPVWACVRRGKQPLRGLNWRRVGAVTRGKLRARLAGVPVGGPYDVHLAVGKSAARPAATGSVRHVWVGDVWILAGQSNMQGCGERDQALAGMAPVRAFYMHDRWGVARDPLHNLWNAVDPVHGGTPDGEDPGVKGVGPGVSFGQAMYAYTGVPQGLLACAHGGTSMAQWDPMHKNLGGYSLYGATVRRVRKTGRVAGVVWYQGESDSMTKAVDEYVPRMKALVRAFRRDCRDPRLPFAMVQLARYAGENQIGTNWNAIQDHQRRLPMMIRRLTTVPAIDLTLSDLVHVGGASQNQLGVRLAEAMLAILDPRGSLPPPIALKRVRVGVPKGEQLATITVEFDHVVGKLESAGRPTGFSMHNGEAFSPGIFDTRLVGSTVQLKTFRTALDFVDKGLHYGQGLDPACNITDSAGRPLPVFGPLPVIGPRLVTPFPKAYQLSRMLPGAGMLAGVAYPKNRKALGFAARATTWNFCNVNPEFGKLKADALAFLAMRIRCKEPMRLAALFGYDGPVKLWVDGKLLTYDPKGKNPAVPDQHVLRFQAGRGEHEILIALGSNGGKAWGVYLRFERVDVPARRIAQEPGRYAVPEWVG